jgi:hypothetical protein
LDSDHAIRPTYPTPTKMTQNYDALLGNVLDSLKEKETFAQQLTREREDRIVQLASRWFKPSSNTVIFIEQNESMTQLYLGREVLGTIVGFSSTVKEMIISLDMWNAISGSARDAIALLTNARTAPEEYDGLWWLIDYQFRRNVADLDRDIKAMAPKESSSEPSLLITHPIPEPAKTE